jgi:Ca2+-transporting ATPase
VVGDDNVIVDLPSEEYKAREISVYDVFVGGVLNLEPGGMIPGDGTFILGQVIKCDKSSTAGESDFVKKTPDDRPIFN